MGNTKSNSKNYKKDSSFWTHIRALSPSSGVYLGAGAFLVLQLLTSLCFPHSAYAASYINVSSGSGGTISLGSIKPSSSGVSASGSDTLTVSTNCNVGYSVYVSGQNGKSTSLTNTNSSITSNNTINASTTTVGSTATALSANTWGISASNTDADAGRYVGLPTYANATSTALTTKSSVSSSSTVPIYYGVKVDTSLSPGSYTGDILYTVLSNSACNVYTVKFNANTTPTSAITGTMSNQSIPVGVATNLSTNAYVRNGYTFLGWSNSANGKTGTMSNGIGTTADVDYTNGQSVTDISGFNTEKTLYAVWMENYIVNYNANGSTSGVPSKTTEGTVLKSGSITTPAENTMVKDGYNFLGWALINNASSSTTPLYSTNTTVSMSTLLSAASTAGQTTIAGSTITLYAVWEKQIEYMQSWTGCIAISEGEQITLRDSRDDRDYTVKKLPDGKCWMTQNLALGMGRSTGLTLSANDTNMPTGSTSVGTAPDASGYYYIPPAGMQGAINSSNTLSSNTTASFSSSSSGDKQAKTQFRSKDSNITNDSDTGYYNFYTATLGYSYYSDIISYGTSNRDICPKGWRLPRTPNTTSDSISSIDSDNDFTYLASRYGSINNGASNSSSYSSTISTVLTGINQGVATNSNNYAGFSYTGLFYVGTSQDGVGSYGSYWSASVDSTGNGYVLYPASSAVWPQSHMAKYFGIAVRCIYQGPTMQNFNASTELPNVGDQTTLTDTRDGKEYTVKRLPDGKVWMTQNLALGMNATSTGLTLTSADTNIDNNTTYYLPPAGKQGSITSSSTLTSTTAANFGTSNDNQAKTQFRSKDTSITNDSDTGYYNFYTATLGYSYWQANSSGVNVSYGSSTRDICPKGWRLPKTPNTTALSISSIGPDNDFAYLAQRYNTDAGWGGSATSYNYSTADSTIKNGIYLSVATNENDYAGFSYSGYWNTSVGSGGYYWSASIYYSGSSYYLNPDGPTKVYPQQYIGKYNGLAVRCIAK